MKQFLLAILPMVLLLTSPVYARGGGGGGRGGGHGGGSSGGHSGGHGSPHVSSPRSYTPRVQTSHAPTPRATTPHTTPKPAATTHVRTYVKPSTGAVVQSHDRTAPNKTQKDNWSSKPNVNPETGKPGTHTPKK